MRYKWGSEASDKTSLEYVLPIITGVLMMLVFRKMGRGPNVYWVTGLSTFMAIFIAAAVLSILKRETKIGALSKAVCITGTVFCIMTFLFVPNTLIATLFLVGAAIIGLAPVVAKYLK